MCDKAETNWNQQMENMCDKGGITGFFSKTAVPHPNLRPECYIVLQLPSRGTEKGNHGTYRALIHRECP